MNAKLIFGGGLVYYVATFLISLVTGPLLHNGILFQAYRQNESFWRPELNMVPPDMAALMPYWVTVGVITSLVLAGIYGVVRGSFAGPGWQKGVKFGLLLALIWATTMAGWSGVFNLPASIWLWWAAEALLYGLTGGAALGWFAERYAPVG